ncbi:MAG: pilus assembly FimT family protein [Nitrospiraceae bacterium]
MVINGHSATIARRTGRARLARLASRALHARRARQSTPQALWSPHGFTLLEMLIVLFLLAGVLVIVLPRIVIGEDLSSTGRKFISELRTLQGWATTGQQPVKLYLDLDRGTYWATMVKGKEEKPPLDAGWATPRSLPESIRFAELSLGQVKREFGRVDVSFYPNGRIDPITVLFIDRNNNLLALAVDSLTGAIRTSDERIGLPQKRRIPDRVKTLLQAAVQGGAGAPISP